LKGHAPPPAAVEAVAVAVAAAAAAAVIVVVAAAAAAACCISFNFLCSASLNIIFHICCNFSERLIASPLE
jgi:hypothetical protein